MAKSSRASVTKRNHANLRKKVFGPVVDARTERLAAKLQEIAAKPRPTREQSNTEEGADGEAQESSNANTADGEGMDLDTKPSKSRVQKSERVQKRNRKPRNSMVFKPRPSIAKKGSKRK